ncbi:MAG: hypothetical protein PHW77_06875, partial [Eubacteriales bacterium]|nr:hypothetical protein [Eubacteriales bacterium]
MPEPNDKTTALKNETAEYLFHQGTNFKSFDYLGAHKFGNGFVFRVWAPNADGVYLTGDFNGWENNFPMKRITEGGIWAAYLTPGDCGDVSFGEGSRYKYIIKNADKSVYKADPYAFYSETKLNTSSLFCDIENYIWEDDEYMKKRSVLASYLAADKSPPLPVNIYEVHLGSWKKHSDVSY